MPRPSSVLSLCAATGFALGVSGLSAMSAVGPLLLGASLIVCEQRALKFRTVRRPADLVGPATELGQARARLDVAQARAHREGELRGLVRRNDGYFFEDAPGLGDDLNGRLVRILVARRQLTLLAETAVTDWLTTTANRDVLRAATLLFVCFVLLLCAFEPDGAKLMFFAGGPLGPLRLSASLLGGVIAAGGLLVAGRAATLAASRGFPARPTLITPSAPPAPEAEWPAASILGDRAGEPAAAC